MLARYGRAVSTLRRLRRRLRHTPELRTWWQWGSVALIVVGTMLTLWAVWKAVSVG